MYKEADKVGQRSWYPYWKYVYWSRYWWWIRSWFISRLYPSGKSYIRVLEWIESGEVRREVTRGVRREGKQRDKKDKKGKETELMTSESILPLQYSQLPSPLYSPLLPLTPYQYSLPNLNSSVHSVPTLLFSVQSYLKSNHPHYQELKLKIKMQ